MEIFAESQLKLAKKIKNTYTNLTKQGKAKVSIGIIDSNLENIKELWEQFKNNDIEMKKLKSEEHDSLPYFKDDFLDCTEEIFVEVRGQLQERKNSLLYLNTAPSTVVNNLASDTNSTTQQVHRKMPTIAIPKFSGKHSEWISFRDLFKSLVIDQPITNIEKFSHLRESLSDDPLVLIKNIPISEKILILLGEG